jgi:2-keto-4-pentenoate hydratase/2-oxohepta-3-ene-1,7-dioic acid hydratase in catechol pathway
VLRGPLFRSKNHDTFCPMGPWLVTADELNDTSDLGMSTEFGDLAVQDGTTSEYIFSPEEIAAYVSGFLTLEPGDVVSCGSVGWTAEAARGLDPTEFRLPSSRGMLKLTIERIGELRNPVRPARPGPSAPLAGES